MHGQANPKIDMVQAENPALELVEGDLRDLSSLIAVVEQVQPDEVYNLGAISFVQLSFKQAELTASHIVKQDVVITTALIPGRPAPRLITAAHVASMKPGSVIVDLAIDNGGNVEGAKLGEVVTTANGVQIVGWSNLPGRIAADASALYARNLVAFVGLMVKDGALAVDLEDEILKASVVTHGGAVVHEGVKG